jgi:hypothetical protein
MKGHSMKHPTPIEAIREKCLDCSNGQPKEVRLCPVKSCALQPFRMGRRPKIELQNEGQETDFGRLEERQQEDPDPGSTG